MWWSFLLLLGGAAFLLLLRVEMLFSSPPVGWCRLVSSLCGWCCFCPFFCFAVFPPRCFWVILLGLLLILRVLLVVPSPLGGAVFLLSRFEWCRFPPSSLLLLGSGAFSPPFGLVLFFFQRGSSTTQRRWRHHRTDLNLTSVKQSTLLKVARWIGAGGPRAKGGTKPQTSLGHERKGHKKGVEQVTSPGGMRDVWRDSFCVALAFTHVHITSFWSSSKHAKSHAHISRNIHMVTEHGYC